MSNLRDQLKKAKLLSKKDAKRLAHEERVHRKQVGRDGLEREQRERQTELSSLREHEREQTRQTQQQLEQARQQAAERAACQDILRNEVLRPHTRGQGRWHFRIADGSLPWFEVDEALRFQLQSGAYWVVRLGPADSHVYGLLPVALARRVQAALPNVVVWPEAGTGAATSTP